MERHISLSVYGIEKPSALLEETLRDNPAHESAWLRTAMLVSDAHESLYCLGCALYINPRNKTIQQALDAFEQAYAPASISLFERVRAFFKRGSVNTGVSVTGNAPAETFAHV